MAERSNALVLKTSEGNTSVGSNPTASANDMEQKILVEYPKFLNKQWCDFLIGLAQTKLEVAGTVGEEIDGYRVANSCWLGDIDSPYLDEIRKQVSIITEKPVSNQEELHIVKYDVGGEYKIHQDFFSNDNPEEHAEIGISGNRTHSFLVYLNDGFEGGETEFPILQKTIQPELGKAICWLNYENGMGITESEHAGLPVTNGEKWILIVWVRENSFDENR